MSEKSESRPFMVKLLAVVGFSATILLIGWAILMIITRGQSTFTSLSDRAVDLQDETRETFSLTASKTVVNSNEPFDISWDTIERNGAYAFSYICTNDITVSVPTSATAWKDVTCGEPLPLSPETQKLTLRVTSKANRYTEVPLRMTFTETGTQSPIVADLEITVLNVTLSAQNDTQTSSGTTGTQTATPAQTTTAPAPVTYTRPVITYPQSNPNGYTDLKVVTLGTGIVERGVFSFTREYERGENNAVMVNVENIGTRTSDYWEIVVELPDGSEYKSSLQYPLKPMEHAVFTIPFTMDSRDDETIYSRIYTSYDINSGNDRTSYEVDY